MMNKESPVKIGLIGVGVAAFIGSWVWNSVKGPDAPTAIGDGGSNDWLTILMQMGGVVSLIVSAWTEVKKQIPPGAVEMIRSMMKDGKVNVAQVISIFSQLDLAAIFEIIKKLKGGILPPIKVDGDDIIVDPQPDAPIRVTPVINGNPIRPATDDEIVRQILDSATKLRQRPLKLELTGNGSQVLSLEIKPPAADASTSMSGNVASSGASAVQAVREFTLP